MRCFHPCGAASGGGWSHCKGPHCNSPCQGGAASGPGVAEALELELPTGAKPGIPPGWMLWEVTAQSLILLTLTLLPAGAVSLPASPGLSSWLPTIQWGPSMESPRASCLSLLGVPDGKVRTLSPLRFPEDIFVLPFVRALNAKHTSSKHLLAFGRRTPGRSSGSVLGSERPPPVQ